MTLSRSLRIGFNSEAELVSEPLRREIEQLKRENQKLRVGFRECAEEHPCCYDAKWIEEELGGSGGDE